MTRVTAGPPKALRSPQPRPSAVDAPHPSPSSGFPDAWQPRARADVVFRPVDDAWLIFDPLTQAVHRLNVTAALVWSACDGAHSVVDLTREMAEVYPDAPAREAVEEALAQFRRAGLLDDR
ncbi:MAG: PqqD family protein [Gemmatimonadetes bacterium]|nr:MAG: PqqD family protein [Gemmatimonadota bacterium]